MSPLRALSVLLLATACSATRATPAAPTPPPAPSTAPAPVVTATPDAGPPPDPRREALVAAWLAAHPQATGAVSVLGEPVDVPDPSQPGARVAAVLMHEEGATLVLTPVPFVAGAQAAADLTVRGAPQEVIAGLAARDLNGDHALDLAVFLRSEDTLEDYAPIQRLAMFYAVRAQPERALAPMIRAEVQLLGVRDAAGLDAALPTMNAYEPAAAGLSPVRFLSRLRYATPAQFRAAVAATGLRLCTDLPDRAGNRRKRCTTLPAARLTDAMITGRIRRDLGVFAEVLSDDGGDLGTPSCQRRGAELRCNANIGGPAGVDWSVVGDGETLRLIEVSPWAESS